MAVRVMNSYNGYAARNAAGMARKKDAEQAVEKAGSRPETTADYVRELESSSRAWSCGLEIPSHLPKPARP